MTVSATTRDRRPGEEDGATTGSSIGGRVPRRGSRRATSSSTSSYVSGHRYGTLRSELERIRAKGHVPLLELETEGALRVKAEDPRRGDDLHLGRRRRARAAAPGARDREHGRDRRANRPRAASSSSRPTSFDYVVENDDLRAGGRGAHGARAAACSILQVPCRRPMIHPRVDDLLQQRRFALCARHRRGQARPADQQLPPPARRGHLRRQSAAARGVALEELPHDGHGGDLRGHAHLRLREVSRTAP